MPRANLLHLLLLTIATAALLADDSGRADFAEAQRIYQSAKAVDEFQLVVGLCERALAKGVPDDRLDELQFTLGCAAYDLGDGPRAVKALRAAVALAPNDAQYRLWLGYAYQLDQRPTLAVREFNRVYSTPQVDSSIRDSALEWLEELHESPAMAEREPAETLVLPGAVIKHHRGEPFVAVLRDALEQARLKLLDSVGVTVAEPVEVLLFRDRDEYRAYHRDKLVPRPEWSTACAAHGRIFCYVPGQDQRDSLLSTIVHEYTHLALRAYADDRSLPCWLDEGLAVLVSGQFPDYRRELAQQSALLSLAALMVPSFAGYEDRTIARLAYAQSKAMTESLLRYQGPVRFRAYLRAIGQGQGDHAAFETAFGRTMDTFYEQWYAEGLDGF